MEGRQVYATTLIDPGQIRPPLKISSKGSNITIILIINVVTIDGQVKYTQRPNSETNVGKGKYVEKISVYFRPI